jgi:NADP-dependent 3-hydroxy acid dehydrogenase YdfG
VVPYCASKFAVVWLTRSVARDLAKHDITGTTTFLASPASDYMTGQIA